MPKIVRKIYSSSETKTVDGEDRSLVVKISTASPDRSNDVVLPQGVKLENYLRNPVVAFGHNYSGLAIGKTAEIKSTPDGIVAKVQFVPQGVYPLADQLYEMYKGGFMNAWSIGFIPKTWSDREDGGRTFEQWELLEYSAVLVPDNPEALTLLRSKGVDTEFLEKSMEEYKTEEEVKDKGVEIKKEEEVVVEPKVEVKEGRILSDKNRKLISSTISQMQEALSSLEELIKAAEPVKEETDKTVERLVVAVRQADKLLGIALRDAKTDGQLRKDRDEARIPVVVGAEGGKN